MNNEMLKLMDESLHELRFFNQRLTVSAQRLGQTVRTNAIGEGEPLNCNPTHADEIRTHISSINHLVRLSTIRIDFIDYELNPDFFSSSDSYPVEIYGKFHSAKIALNTTCKEQKVKIKLHNEHCKNNTVNAIRLIDILPFLLLDNAVKYSPNGCEVNVYFITYSDEVEVSIKSTGPYVPNEEIKKLYLKGYRGKNARDLKIKGQGIGLYFADRIVKLHDSKMSIESSTSCYSYNNIRYSDFTVTLRFPLASSV